jgi:branched-chain amino acid transport system substrate-binding protein
MKEIILKIGTNYRKPTSCSIVVLLFLMLLASFTFAEQEQKKKFVVGLILPLTGQLADYGEALRNGFKLAEEEEPKLFEHIELRYQDSQYDQKAALNAFNALEQQGGVNLYHTWGVSPNETILPVADTKRRPVLAETSMRSAAVKRPYVVRVSRTSYDAAGKLVEAFTKKNWRRVGIIITQIPYYTDVLDGVKEFGSRNGIEIDVLGEVTPAEQDFRSYLLKAKGKNYDALGTLVLLNQLLNLCEQAKTIHFERPMFGAHIHNTLEGMKRCLPLSNGAIFPGQVVSDKFREAYRERFKNDLRLDSAAHSYETARVIAGLFGNEQSHAFSADEILAKLKTVKQSSSSVGPYEYSESPEGGKSISFNEIILTFKDDKIVPLKE